MASTTSNNRRARWLATLGAAVVFWVTPARADAPSPSDLATARELYLEARELRSTGDAKAALAKYRGAWATAPTPIIGVELGRTHVQLGELIEARETFLAVARLPIEPDETKRSAQARDEASTLADELRPKIPSLVVEIRGASNTKHPSLTIDGANVPLVSGAATRKINPGKHELVARLGNAEKKESLELAEGDSKQIAIDLAGDVGAVDSPSPSPSPSDASTSRAAGVRPVLVYGGFGLAGVGLVLGSVTGIMAISKANAVKSACSGKLCPEGARSNVDAGRTLATVSTIGFGATVVGAAVGMIGLFVVRPNVDAPRAGSNGRFLPRVAPNAAFVSGGAVFGAEGIF